MQNVQSLRSRLFSEHTSLGPRARAACATAAPNMERSKMKRTKNCTGGTKLPDSIAEGMVLQTFSHDDDEVVHVPPSPRMRSRSWVEGSHIRAQNLQVAVSNPGHSDGTDSCKPWHYESLPTIYRQISGKLNTQLLLAVQCCNVLEVRRLLEAGASPSATCHTEYISACHIAALHDSEVLSVLLERGAERARPDRLGRTALHLAAWSGHLRPLLALLALPQELQYKLENGELIAEAEEEIRRFSKTVNVKDMIDVRCHLGDIDVVVSSPDSDNIDHCCREIDLPFLHPGWTALHAGAARARAACCRVLLAAGADPCARDLVGRAPLDVAGSACLYGTQVKQPGGSTLINSGFTDVVKLLLTKSCKRVSLKKSIMLDTPLHTAVELNNAEAVLLLLQAGVSPRNMNRAGLTPLHLCVKKRLKKLLQTIIYYGGNDELRYPGIVNAIDKDGNTVLHYAVANDWLAGVCICLEAGANIIFPANNRETPLHTAAALGYLDILKKILHFAKKTNTVDVANHKGETALFKAIINDQTECVKMILQESASIKIVLPRNYNVFHVAAKLGHVDILKVLLDHDYSFTREKVNAVTSDDRRGFGPIHFAVEKNHIECVKLMLSKNAFISLKTTSGVHKESTPLHIAARKNNLEIVKVIIKFDVLTIHNVDAMGWTPLHTASYYACRDVIRLLILEGADLSACTTGPQKYQKTAVEIMMENLSKPTEFLESIFDMCIHRPSKIISSQSVYSESSFQDPDTEVIVDFNILLPKSATQNPDIKFTAIEAILKTGNRSGQKRLLIHPLVESYLCLRWKALLPFFYVMLCLYGMFVLTLTLFVMTDYGYRDSNMVKPSVWDTTFWTYALYITIAMVIMQEVIFLSASLKHYVLQKETWVKLASIILAMILPKLISDRPTPPVDAVDWARHVATMAIVLCWLDLTFLLSRFPNWGYYVLMFGKVCANVVKILLTFAFLVIGFALSFMIQFHHKTSFESFWAALVKTMVMMTSEFDYDDLVDKKDTHKNPHAHSLAIIRFVFLIFLILGAIVLMNLMVGVAVHDLHNLEVLGHIMRLEKQVEFLASLETLVLKRFFIKLLPSKWIYNLRFSIDLTRIYLRPCEPSWSYYKAIPARVRDAIFEKAVTKKKSEDNQVSFESLKKQLSEIHEAITSPPGGDSGAPEQQPPDRLFSDHSAAPHRLTDTDMIVVRMKRQVDSLSAKIDVMMDVMMMKSHESQIRKSQ